MHFFEKKFRKRLHKSKIKCTFADDLRVQRLSHDKNRTIIHLIYKHVRVKHILLQRKRLHYISVYSNKH